ncbi:MAG: hypothetical protein NTV86_00710 [Planctomycetota bacterium]|nr:hypothetical protein [Planctomycetota bacterium]
MSNSNENYLGFKARRVGTEGYEIVAPNGKVWGWAVDGSTAMLMTFGLNWVLLNEQVVPEIDDAPVDGVVASDKGGVLTNLYENGRPGCGLFTIDQIGTASYEIVHPGDFAMASATSYDWACQIATALNERMVRGVQMPTDGAFDLPDDNGRQEEDDDEYQPRKEDTPSGLDWATMDCSDPECEGPDTSDEQYEEYRRCFGPGRDER